MLDVIVYMLYICLYLYIYIYIWIYVLYMCIYIYIYVQKDGYGKSRPGQQLPSMSLKDYYFTCGQEKVVLGCPR